VSAPASARILFLALLGFNAVDEHSSRASCRRPALRDLPRELSAVARSIAERLRAAGFEAWLVGGAVRDLALGIVPREIDMATDAPPDAVQELFPRTLAVGKAFGTVIVQWNGMSVELTTFRAEEGYSDARRPDAVSYGSSVEEDAARRDFTCNAMYLDPLRGDFRDPERGLADLRAGLLRCVGDARRRFREDGLRLVRLARFAARFDLEPAPGTRAAALAELDSLRGVSAERLLAELEAILCGDGPARALRILRECGVLARVLPALGARGPAGEEAQEQDVERRLAALAELGRAPGAALGLALLFDPAPLAPGGEEELARAERDLAALRPARALRSRVRAIWAMEREITALVAGGRTRAERLRAMRAPAWREALLVLGAERRAAGLATAGLFELEAERLALAPGELAPEPLVTARDLEPLGLARGPAWGALLREAETRQLEGELATRAQALRWLRAAVRARDGGERGERADPDDPDDPGDPDDQDGGKASRKDQESG